MAHIELLPRKRHLNCTDKECRICHSDAIALQEYLRQKTKLPIGHLRMYCKFLNSKNIVAEEYDNPSQWAFEPSNIEEFIKLHQG